MRQIIPILILGALTAVGECVHVSRDVIVAADLAAVIPAFSGADPGLVIAYAPLPGVKGTLSRQTLALAARKAQISDSDLPAYEVCVEREARTLTEGELIQAMTKSLHDPAAELTIVDHSRFSVPSGSLVFPISSLGVPALTAPDDPVFWRGSLMYDGTKSVQVWAKVRISVPRTLCVATAAIHAGSVIVRDQVTLVQRRVFPFRSRPAIEDIDQVVGRETRRTLQEGQEFTAEALVLPLDVRAGDVVRVTVRCGNALVSLDAVAASGGRKGDLIVLKNPSSHANFRANIDGRGRAVIPVRKSEPS